MTLIMLLPSNPRVMGLHMLPSLRRGGWIASIVIVLAGAGINLSWM
jgi:hypothetical protein